MRQHPRILALLIPVFLLTVGCARRENLSTLNLREPIKTFRATAIVEFTKTNTEKGRAIITISTPDSFRIEIKGPFGITTALISGSNESFTFLYRGKSTTFSPGDESLPLKIRAAELVSLLTGAEDFATPEDGTFEVQDLPDGKIITRRKKNQVLYRATMSEYKKVSGAYIPHSISVKGRDYKLAVKYIRVYVNPEINNSYFKTAR